MYAEWKQRVSATRRGGGLFLVGLLLLMVIGIVIARSSASSPRGLGPQVHSAALPLSGSWVPTALREQVTSLLLVPQQPSLLLAATTTGVWRSTDAGRTWQADGTGLEGQAIFVLAGTPRGTGIWAGGFDGAVYERGSPVGGQAAWRRISWTCGGEEIRRWSSSVRT